MSDPLLTLNGVYTDIDQYHILQGVDLTVPRGAVTMLLGRNGVGKTTTLRTVIGHWSAKAGSITYDGQDITACQRPPGPAPGLDLSPKTWAFSRI